MFTPLHSAVSVLVDAKELLDRQVNGPDDLGPSDWEELLASVEEALAVSEIAAIAAEFAAANQEGW